MPVTMMINSGRIVALLLATALAPLHAEPWFDGGDLSALARIEELGGRFRDKDGKFWRDGSCALWRPDATPLPALRQLRTH